jgi:hypothetical protein
MCLARYAPGSAKGLLDLISSLGLKRRRTILEILAAWHNDASISFAMTVARCAPDSVNRLLDLISSLGREEMHAILKILAARRNGTGMNFAMIVARFAPDSVNRLLDLISSLGMEEMHTILEILATRDNVSGVDFAMIVARFAPDSVKEFLTFIRRLYDYNFEEFSYQLMEGMLEPMECIENANIIVKILTTVTSDNFTLSHIILEYSPDVFMDLLNLLIKARPLHQMHGMPCELMKMFTAQSRSDYIYMKRVANRKPEALGKFYYLMREMNSNELAQVLAMKYGNYYVFPLSMTKCTSPDDILKGLNLIDILKNSDDKEILVKILLEKIPMRDANGTLSHLSFPMFIAKHAPSGIGTLLGTLYSLDDKRRQYIFETILVEKTEIIDAYGNSQTLDFATLVANNSQYGAGHLLQIINSLPNQDKLKSIKAMLEKKVNERRTVHYWEEYINSLGDADQLDYVGEAGELGYGFVYDADQLSWTINSCS